MGVFCIYGGDPINQESFKLKFAAIISAEEVGYSRLMGDDEEAIVSLFC
jgi:hypothetical protein